MKTLINGVVILCVLVAWCTSARAQAPITILASDVTSRLAVGNTIINNDDTLTTSVNIGSTGPNTLWDFSGLLKHNTTTLTSVAVASTPYVAQYPGATHALKTSLAGVIAGVPGTVSGDLYLYLKAGPSNLLNPGNSGGGTVTIPGLGTFPGALVVANVPADTTYAIPSTLGTRWGSTYTSTTTITLNSLPISSSTVNRALTYLVDAYGSLKVPGGSTQDALRIRSVDAGGGGTTVGYIFLAKNGASVQLKASDPNAPSSGTITVQKSVSWSGPFITSVRATDGIPQEFALQQNYPNPFNPNTTITYQLPSSARVNLRVFDVLGREVATLVNEEQPAGVHSAVWNGAGMASGVYTYRLEAGTFTATKRMVLVK